MKYDRTVKIMLGLIAVLLILNLVKGFIPSIVNAGKSSSSADKIKQSIIESTISSTPGEVAIDYLRSIEKGEVKHAYSLLTAGAKKNMEQIYSEPLIALADVSKVYSENGGFKRIDVVSEETVDVTSTVKLKIVSGNGKEITVPVMLVKENTAWHIAK